MTGLDAIGQAKPAPRPRYATFLVGELYFGVDVLRVQEVLRRQPMTPVPGADAAIAGLINLRGQIVTAVDLRRRLGLPPRTPGPELTPDSELLNVVLQGDDGAVSLLVDEIGDVIEVDPDAFEDPPPTLSGAAREAVRGVYKLDGRLLLALSADRMLSL